MCVIGGITHAAYCLHHRWASFMVLFSRWCLLIEKDMFPLHIICIVYITHCDTALVNCDEAVLPWNRTTSMMKFISSWVSGTTKSNLGCLGGQPHMSVVALWKDVVTRVYGCVKDIHEPICVSFMFLKGLYVKIEMWTQAAIDHARSTTPSNCGI
jgi:hypothetical protein